MRRAWKIMLPKARPRAQRTWLALPLGRPAFDFSIPALPLVAILVLTAGALNTRAQLLPGPDSAGGFLRNLLDDHDGIGPADPAPDAGSTVMEPASPLQITRESNAVFRVENHFHFTDAQDCKFTWQLRQFASPLSNAAPFTAVRSGFLDAPAIPPGRSGLVKIPGVSPKSADALALRVDDPAGRELGVWVWPLRRLDFYRLTQEPAEHRAVPAETNGVITITTGDLAARFSRTTGLLLGVRRGSQEFSLTNGPRLTVGGATLRQLHFDDDGPDAFVSAKFDGNLRSIFWRVNGNGWINCEYAWSAAVTNGAPGLSFDYPGDLILRKRWLGDGPYPVWKNRLAGVSLGVWESARQPAARDWFEPEFTGCFSGVRWLQLETREGLITILNHSGVPFVQLPPSALPPANLAGNAAAPAPGYGLAFLECIPASGPQPGGEMPADSAGQTNAIPAEYLGSLGFHFGPLP
jgi:hypothetical protein